MAMDGRNQGEIRGEGPRLHNRLKPSMDYLVCHTYQKSTLRAYSKALRRFHFSDFDQNHVRPPGAGGPENFSHFRQDSNLVFEAFHDNEDLVDVPCRGQIVNHVLNLS